MTFTDSDSCTSYEVPSKAYPRFRFVQDRLQSFCPRFLKTVEKLPKGLKWVDLVNDISKRMQPLVENKPEVILFGQNHTLVQKDSILSNKSGLEETGCNISNFSRMDLLSHVSTSKPQVLVYTCAADQVKQVSLHLERELSTRGLDSVIVLPDVGGRTKEEAQVLLEEVFKSMSGPGRDMWRNKVIVNMSDEALSTGISNILEMRVVREFQRIDGCINELLSIRRQFPVVIFEDDYLVVSLNKGILQNTTGVQDLMDLANKAEGCDYFTFIEKQIIHFIERTVAAQFSVCYKIADSYVHTMLEEFNFRKKCQSQISETTSLSIQSDLSEIYMESQTFDDEYVMETDEEQSEKMQMDEKPQSAYRKHRNKRNRRLIAKSPKMLIKDLQAVLKNAELLIHGVCESLTILHQMQFEVKGVLSNTILFSEEERNIWTIREHKNAESMETEEQTTEDPFEFWIDKLISLHEVQGCGDYFGKLIVFISDLNSAAEKREVIDNIAKCLAGCPYDYDVKFVTVPFKTKTFADPEQDEIRNRMPDSTFKAGQRIKFQGMSGTLGLFVHDTLKQSVYLITNGHLVSGGGQVQVITEDASETEIGRETWNYRVGVIDIAAVKVQKNLVERCDLKIKDQHGNQCSYMMVDTRKFPPRKLVGKPVFKRGADTDLTYGVISSGNIKYKEEGIIKTYNMLISPPPGSDVDAVFAKEGDSGSVVSLCTIETNPIYIIAMLIGGKFASREANVSAQDIRFKETGTERLCLTFSLMDGIDALNETHTLDLDIDS